MVMTKKQDVKPLPETREAQHLDEMDKNKMIVMLQYRIERYKAMGNGSMCQNLLSQLNKLQGSYAAKAN